MGLFDALGKVVTGTLKIATSPVTGTVKIIQGKEEEAFDQLEEGFEDLSDVPEELGE